MEGVWGVTAGASVRVRGSARRIEARLDRGVAAQANRCHVVLRRGGTVVQTISAEMRHVRGVGACRRGPKDRVVARGDVVVVATPQPVVTVMDSPQEYLRACPSATSRFMTIGDIGFYGRLGGRDLVVSPGGVVAWVVRLVPDQLQVRALDGTVRTLDTGAISGLAVSADGTTLTWLSAGQPRSAPIA